MRSLMALGVSAALSAATLTTSTTGTGSYERWLRIHNQTSYELCEVYISHVDTNSWGPDILGSTCLSPGYYRTVDPGYQQGYCKMDLKFVFEDDDVVVRRRYNICEGTDFYLND